MPISITELFQSSPEIVRQGVIDVLRAKAPQVISLLSWNAEKTRASGSKLGASFALEIKGQGPTELVVTGAVGGLAALAFSEERAAAEIRGALKCLKSQIP